MWRLSCEIEEASKSLLAAVWTSTLGQLDSHTGARGSTRLYIAPWVRNRCCGLWHAETGRLENLQGQSKRKTEKPQPPSHLHLRRQSLGAGRGARTAPPAAGGVGGNSGRRSGSARGSAHWATRPVPIPIHFAPLTLGRCRQATSCLPATGCTPQARQKAGPARERPAGDAVHNAAWWAQGQGRCL